MEKVTDKFTQAGDAIQDSAGFGNSKVASIKGDIVDGHIKSQKMTTDFGVGMPEAAANAWLKVVDNDAGKQGPMLLEDSIARERIHRFDHERIPERVVHARGAGAFGYFKLKESASDVTHAVFSMTLTARRPYSFAFQPSLAPEVVQIQSATYEVSRLSFTLRKGTGT